MQCNTTNTTYKKTAAPCWPQISIKSQKEAGWSSNSAGTQNTSASHSELHSKGNMEGGNHQQGGHTAAGSSFSNQY